MKRLTMDLILETGGYGLKVDALSFGPCQARPSRPSSTLARAQDAPGQLLAAHHAPGTGCTPASPRTCGAPTWQGVQRWWGAAPCCVCECLVCLCGHTAQLG